MLPDRLIELQIVDATTTVPSWLSSRDEVWLRAFCEEIDAFAGRTVAGTESRARELGDVLARHHAVATRRVEGVWLVERRRWRKIVDAPVDPQRLRSVVFDGAARHERGEALARAAEVLGIDPGSLERHLFADREDERILVPPEAAASPASLVDSYNLVLAQSVLARATRIKMLVRSDARHVVSYAKLLGLMATFVERHDGVEIDLSGPLSIFHATTKYGHAVARLLPALASTVGWAAIAEVRLRGQTHVIRLSASDPLPRSHALPRGHDSKLEKRVARDLRVLGPARGWRLERESAVVSTGVGGQLFYPDFTLVSARGGRVLVEVVGFWTPEYLAKKQHALAAVREPIVVCVDERHTRELGIPKTESAVVVTYRDHVDAAVLLDAAERALSGATIQ
jgi:predicted nuclease of restriction endonuclease-like RecB superfamily